MTEQSTIRTFVAIELPEEVKQTLTSAQDGLRSTLGRVANTVRWTRPEGIHLTLQFLGDVAEDAVPDLEKAIRAAAAGSRHISLDLGDLGVFPNLRRPRVLWAGINGTPQALKDLQRLHRAVSDALTPLGFKPDKSFDPHLTLGRVRDTVRPEELAAVADAISSHASRLIPTLSFQVGAISLIKSDLQPGGSIYTCLAHLELPR